MAINLNTCCSSQQLANVSHLILKEIRCKTVTVIENVNLEKGRANLDFVDFDDILSSSIWSRQIIPWDFTALIFRHVSNRSPFTREILTADAAMFLVGAIATSVPAAASYCVGTTSSIVASEWAVSRGDSATITHPARCPGLVTAVSAGYHRVAKFVCWQALTVVASERTLGTFCTGREISRIN